MKVTPPMRGLAIALFDLKDDENIEILQSRAAGEIDVSFLTIQN